ncbi:GlyGly-CTERM sorting domain-containing protein [Photobacterium frigidiphilum]|uniref:Serine protease n=1 Tax=Photobacterium frigidiphilum TaxID=264736 RepID=A0A2T3J662_9GAMM|nr:trypsin-like serine protease [Photobacterium frigidiphilum]PSU42833.1 GlyGly-CTERM sorting domain-containing protein [Photobacterium frigidiphilum]
MKKHTLSLLALSLIGTFTAPTYAVEGGTSLSWADHPYLIESQCTGTVLGGQYVLLAGHCANSVDSPFPRQVNLSNSESLMPTHRETLYDPSLPVSEFADVALWTLPSTAPMDKVLFVADLNDAASTVNLGDNVSFMGFGQDDHTPRLGQAKSHITDAVYGGMGISYSDPLEHSVPGDSGAPISNADNKIIGVNYSATGSIDPITGLYEQNGVNLHFVKNWLLQNINRWHSATELKFTGDKTIEVQSLHVNNIDMATRQNNGTLTTGDVTVTGGTCVTDGAVTPFGMCTLELKSGAGEGKVMLEDGNDITINRAPDPDPKPVPKPDNGSSGGGSLGWLGLLGLLAVAIRRKA